MATKRTSPWLAWLAGSFLAALCAQTDASEGLRLLPDHASASGRASGVAVFVNDAGATRLNPALLSEVDELSAVVTAALYHITIDYTSSSGETESMRQNWHPGGSLYAAYPIVKDRVTAGLGVTAPYGLGQKWPRQGIFKYTLPFELLLLNATVNPALGVRLTDTVSVGLGMDIVYSRLKISQYYPWALVTGVPGTPDADMDFKLEGWGLGGYASINWDVAKNHRLALIARLPIDVEYDGHFNISHIAAPIPGVTGRSDLDSQITYPSSIMLAYGWQVTAAFRVAGDFEYSWQSTHDDLILDAANNNVLFPSNRLELNWRDNYAYGVGFDWMVTENWTLRGGWRYSRDQMPDRNFTPIVASDDRHIVALGAGYRKGRHALDLSYSYSFYPEREVVDNVNPRLNGKWEIGLQLINLSYTYGF